MQEKFDSLVTQNESLTRSNTDLVQLVDDLRRKNSLLDQQAAACTCRGVHAAHAPTRLVTPPPLVASSAPGQSLSQPGRQAQQQQQQQQPRRQQPQLQPGGQGQDELRSSAIDPSRLVVSPYCPPCHVPTASL